MCAIGPTRISEGISDWGIGADLAANRLRSSARTTLRRRGDPLPLWDRCADDGVVASRRTTPSSQTTARLPR